MLQESRAEPVHEADNLIAIAINISKPYSPARPITGIALTFMHFNV
jgi:hypothetical protein